MKSCDYTPIAQFRVIDAFVLTGPAITFDHDNERYENPDWGVGSYFVVAEGGVLLMPNELGDQMTFRKGAPKSLPPVLFRDYWCLLGGTLGGSSQGNINTTPDDQSPYIRAILEAPCKRIPIR